MAPAFAMPPQPPHEAVSLAFKFKGTSAQRLVLMKLANDLAAGKPTTSVAELKRTWPAGDTYALLPALLNLQTAGLVDREHLDIHCSLSLEALRSAVAKPVAGGAK